MHYTDFILMALKKVSSLKNTLIIITCTTKTENREGDFFSLVPKRYSTTYTTAG